MRALSHCYRYLAPAAPQPAASSRLLPLLQGALLRSASIADSRTAVGSRSQVRRMLRYEHRKLRDTLWELLAQHAPSARR